MATISVPAPVYLAAGSTGLQPIHSLLAEARIEYRSSEDLGGAPKEQLSKVLSECRAVVAYLTAARPPAGVLLEIGAGIGRGLPVVVVLGSKVRSTSLPAALRELPSMRLPVDVSSDGATRLRSLLTAIEKRPSSSRQVGSIEGGRERWADESERLTAEALQRLGAGIVGYEPANRRGKPDLAAWFPDLPGVPYNPVLVEVAGRTPDLVGKRAQLRGYMRDADALIGFLVVPGTFDPEWRVLASGAVLTIGVQSLGELQPEEFARILRDGRNYLFHAP